MSSTPEILRTCPTCGTDIPLHRTCPGCEPENDANPSDDTREQERLEEARMLAQGEAYKFDVQNPSQPRLFFQTFSWREILFIVGALFFMY